MKVIDDFLSESAFEVTQQFFLGSDIPWYYNDTIAGDDKGIDAYQFVYTFFNVQKPFSCSCGNYSNFLQPILTKISPLYLLRAKANLRPRTKEHFRSNFHVDMNLGQTTAIYYLNSNNGSTVFKDSGDKVESVANRLIVFDGSIEHAGTSCTDDSRRVVLNINYIPSELDPLR